MVFKTGSFSRAGALALVKYLEQVEDDTGEEMELDPIGFACDYTEYDSLREAADDFVDTPNWDAALTDEENNARIRAFFQDNSTLIEFQGGVIVQNF